MTELGYILIFKSQKGINKILHIHVNYGHKEESTEKV